MFKSIPIISNHKDLIHDVAFDYYGKRMATCSGDHTINVWDLNSKNEWESLASWKAHNGPIWKISWAHPEFGQVLASCSYDRTIIIWEEIYNVTNSKYALSSPDIKNSYKWIKRASLVDSRSSVTSIQFAPHYDFTFFFNPYIDKNNDNTISKIINNVMDNYLGFGLALVSASSDGILRFYEAPDVTNLSQWSLTNEIVLSINEQSININSPVLNTNLSTNTLIYPNNKNLNLEISLSFSNCRILPPLLAVGLDNSHNINQNINFPNKDIFNGEVQIYQNMANGKKWILVDNHLAMIAQGIKDIKFAPDMGKSHHILAVATLSGVHIFALQTQIEEIQNKEEGLDAYFEKNNSFLETISTPMSTSPINKYFRVHQMAFLSSQNHNIWRVAWNLTGSVLASSGHDGLVRLWKADYVGKWKCSAILKNDGLFVHLSSQNVSDPEICKETNSNNQAKIENDIYDLKQIQNKILSQNSALNKNMNKIYKNAKKIDSPSQVVWH
ncbi:unnamed protein product [Gordionus sp. m RMFG-2023]|uniref:nucleoporin SEH1-like n=1 Tax=Gordionus sp. m RMFG-2023 TaxID=3053472 RepID=UPI0030DF3B04